MKATRFDAVLIGGGFYGCCLALFLREYLDRVAIVERENNLLLRASSINQARVHTGYHYPRSLLTAYRSFVNFPRFVLDFRRSIMDDFTKLYAVARNMSKVNARQFHELFKRMKASIEIAPKHLKQHFDTETVEEVFLVREVAFDADILREIMWDKVKAAGIEVFLKREVAKVEQGPDDRVIISFENSDETFEAGNAFNCTYSRLNVLLNTSGFELLPLKHEITEVALIEVPDELQNLGITVMDGPFFSTMPFPSKGCHSLSHVRYTPHGSWFDTDNLIDGYEFLLNHPPRSNYSYMIKDAERFLPIISGSRYVESLFEVKTKLISNEFDDGRPILYKKDYGIKNYSVVLGGKIDNIYDVLEVIADAKGSLGLSKKPFKGFSLSRG